MRVLTLSDSDSYLKWAVALLAGAPADWAVRHLVLDNVIAPSDAQIAAVVEDHPGHPVSRVSGLGLAREVRRLAPDVLLVSCTGPAIEAVRDLLVWRDRGWGAAGRPVLATGLPGISIPANQPALRHRRDFDLMILHSHREVRDYAAVRATMGAEVGAGPRLALARLPFLTTVRGAEPAGRAVIFAAQSLVPEAAGQRRAILVALAGLPAAFDPVVKVRAVAGERQAHNEALPYAELWATMEQPRPIDFVAGSMAAALRGAAGFATVSSTAALEAIAAEVPVLVLDEFGVSDALINSVFVDSGLLGGLDQLAAADFRRPRPQWLAENYFHPAADNDWIPALEDLVATRRRTGLPAIAVSAPDRPLVRARRLLRVLPPASAWRTLRRLGIAGHS